MNSFSLIRLVINVGRPTYYGVLWSPHDLVLSEMPMKKSGKLFSDLSVFICLKGKSGCGDRSLPIPVDQCYLSSGYLPFNRHCDDEVTNTVTSERWIFGCLQSTIPRQLLSSPIYILPSSGKYFVNSQVNGNLFIQLYFLSREAIYQPYISVQTWAPGCHLSFISEIERS